MLLILVYDGTKWASKAVHPVTEYDGTIINDMSIAHIVYKFHNWQESSKLPYENETLVDDREILTDCVGHHRIEYKYNKTGYRVGLYICGNCGSYGVAGIIGLLNKSSGACIACKQITPYDEVNERVTKCGLNLITDKKDYIGASSIDVMCACSKGTVFTTRLSTLEYKNMGGCKNCRHPNAIPYDDEVSAVTKCESTLTTTERDECSNSSDIDVLCTWEYKNMGDYKNCRHPNYIPLMMK